MGLETDILVTNYGLSQDFASRFIQFTGGDVETAIKIIESSDRDVVAVKMKFISSRKMSNGAVLLFYDYQLGNPVCILSVVSTDSALSKLRLENPWNTMYDEMVGFLGANESDTETSSKVEDQIFNLENISYIKGFFSDRSNIDMVNFKRFILSEVSKVMMDTGIILKIITEDIDIFHFRNFFSNFKAGKRIATETFMDQNEMMTLRIDPVLSPLGGKDIEQVVPGDEILVRVLDTREIVPTIIKLLDAKTPTGAQVYGRVKMNQKSEDTQNTLILLEFAPGIFGKFVIGGKVRVQYKERNKDINAALNDTNQGASVSLENAARAAAESVGLQGLNMSDNEESTEKKKIKKNSFLTPLIAIVGIIAVGLFILFLFIL